MGSTSEIALQGWREKGGVPNAGGLGFPAENSARKAVGSHRSCCAGWGRADWHFSTISRAGDAEWTGTGESDGEEPGWGVIAAVGVGVPFSFSTWSQRSLVPMRTPLLPSPMTLMKL